MGQGPDLATTESVGFLQKACQSSTAVSAKFCLGPILQRRKHTTIRFGDLRTRARRLQAANNPSAGCLANRFERAVRNSIRVSIQSNGGSNDAFSVTARKLRPANYSC